MIVLFFFFFFLAMGILVPLQTIKLRSSTQKIVRTVSYDGLFWLSLVSVASALLIAFGVGYAVMFGPSHITGDFIGLPWYTMLPALGISIWVYITTNRAALSALFARAEAIAEKNQRNTKI